MCKSLDGARLKVIRAEEHFNVLKAEICAYMQSHEQPRRLKEHEDDPVAVFIPVPPDQTPRRWSILIGDCVTNARAALDYIVWELASRYMKIPPTARDKWISFPIFNDPRDQGLIDKLKCFENRQFPTGAVDIIRSVQPHNTGYEPLWWLHEIVNQDKHRMVVLTIGNIDKVVIYKTVAGSTTLLGSGQGGKTELSTTDANVNVYGKTTISVTFENVAMPLEPVERTLEQVIKCVAHIIPRFEPFLG